MPIRSRADRPLVAVAGWPGCCRPRTGFELAGPAAIAASRTGTVRPALPLAIPRSTRVALGVGMPEADSRLAADVCVVSGVPRGPPGREVCLARLTSDEPWWPEKSSFRSRRHRRALSVPAPMDVPGPLRRDLVTMSATADRSRSARRAHMPSKS